MEWVKCSDRLPEDEGDFLTWPRKHQVTTHFHPYDDFQESSSTALIKKNSWYRTDDNGFDYPVDNITHWMPLPDAPQSNENLKTRE